MPVMKITIYHNFRCSKSKATLDILKDKLSQQKAAGKKIQLEVIDYLLSPPTEEELQKLAQRMKVTVRDLLRTNEYYYEKLQLDNKALSEDYLLGVMVRFPILIQRPIIVSGKGVVIGRPPENVLAIIE